MCGRFTLRSLAESLRQVYGLAHLPDIGPRYNIAPSQPIPVVRDARDGRRLEELRWGLVPHWADDPSIGNRMINARAETVADKPAYREAFRQRRCLVAADGFYEWERIGNGRKQPWFVRLKSDGPFAFAGLWERWRDPRQGGTLESSAFLTTEPNELVAPIHDRMPVILVGEAMEAWLDPDTTETSLHELLEPLEPGAMEAHPVSVHVNDPAHDDARCLRPVNRAPDNRKLF